MAYRAPTDACDYYPHMENIGTEILEKVLDADRNCDLGSYTDKDVKRALGKGRLEPDDFAALLSPAAEPFLEDIAKKARKTTREHFGNAVTLFTPLYASNYCENRCQYCGFNACSDISRARLTEKEVEKEMDSIASTGLTDLLLLTGESRRFSDMEYIGMCVRKAAERFSSVGLEIYPANSGDYRFLHGCGADYVTVFQETYDPETYSRFHLGGPKRVMSYRFNAQERALIGGMRGVGFAALLGLRDDWRKDAFCCGVHAYLIQRKYPHAEIAFSLPRLRPTAAHKEDDVKVSESNLLQVAMAYRLFMPFASETISTRESPRFRDGIVNICATKISAGSSVEIGGHSDVKSKGGGQFELSDTRNVAEVREALAKSGLQPIFNDYVRSDRWT
ncbi:MAG: 2-iminoacetate synthase ThiH [Candidatus Methanomethylophilaceae archaeon]|nr:2-iminoacetate synthase ThiH [Candidatus Methanomethylophilaceae archaeon]